MSDKYGIESHKLIYHPERVAQWQAAGDDWEKLKKVYPIYVEVAPSGTCNHRCSFCAFDYIGYKTDYLSLEVMGRIVPEMASLGVKSILHGGEGEPLLNKNIIQISKVIQTSGIDQALTTNAVLLKKRSVEEMLENFSWVKVSIGAGTPATYAQIHDTRESDFDRVIANLKYAVEFRNKHKLKCAIGAQIILLPENADEIGTLAKICRDVIGLDYLVVKPHSQHQFSLSSMYKDLNYRDLLQSVCKYENMSNKDFRLVVRKTTMLKKDEKRSYKICHSTPFFWAHIQANGDVYGCSAYLQIEEFNLGNINEKSFQDIWEGERRKGCYEYVQRKLGINNCRTNCRMNYINEYLDKFKNPVEHVNFI